MNLYKESEPFMKVGNMMHLDNFTEHKPITDFGTPTEYEQFLMQREAFIETTLYDQDRLFSSHTVHKVTRQDLIDLASNPVDFATLRKVINISNLKYYDSIKGF